MEATALFVVCGGLTGLLSMLLYAKISPQARVATLAAQISAAQSELIQLDDADLRAVLQQARHAIGLSLQQIKLIFFPVTLAGLAVLGAAWLVDSSLDLSRRSFAPAWKPDWLFSGHVAFWVPLTLSALAVKWRLKIK